MSSNKEKFLSLVTSNKGDTIDKNKSKIKSRAMLRESQSIALKVLEKLHFLGWTQKDLAHQMDVSPQQINKIVKGKENLTLETQIKLQSILDIPILATYFDQKEQNKKAPYSIPEMEAKSVAEPKVIYD